MELYMSGNNSVSNKQANKTNRVRQQDNGSNKVSYAL